jgi:hypothetical protein
MNKLFEFLRKGGLIGFCNAGREADMVEMPRFIIEAEKKGPHFL